MALKTAQGHLDSRSQTYLTFSITDPVEGALTFYWGDANYSATNAYGGVQVSPCVIAWGNLVKYMPDGDPRQNHTVIRLAANEYVTATNVASRFKVIDVLQDMDIRDVLVTVYQWNQGDTSQEVIWKGYWGGIVGYDFSGGHAAIDVSLSSLERDSTDTIGSVINRTDDPDAPNNAIGMMKTKGYGSLLTTVDSANEDSTNVIHPILLGYSSSAGQALVIDEGLTYTKLSSRYLACQNDGVSAAKTTGIGAISTGSIGKWYLYDKSTGYYAHIESTDVSSSNNSTSETTIDLANSPLVYFVLRPKLYHSSTSAGIAAADIANPINDDPTDYVTITETDPVVAYEVPHFTLPTGAEILEARVAVELWKDGSASASGNGVHVAIWDPYTGGGQAWGGVNNYKNFTNAVLTYQKRNQLITSGTGTGGGTWGVWSTESADSTGTMSEFLRGFLASINTAVNNELRPLVIRVQWNSNPASGHTFRVYSVALLLKVRYSYAPIGERPPRTDSTISGFFKDALATLRENREPRKHPEAAPGIQVFWVGEYQADDGSGTITGSASALISKAPDVARHLIQVIGGKTVNSTSGTLGNFVDQRTEGTAGERNCTPIFGPGQVFTRTDALNELMAHFPWLKVYPEDGTYQCIVDQLNPHSSQVYRSTSDPVEIEPWDIIEQFHIEELDPRKFVNKVTVNVGHSYGRSNPVASYTYNNPLSQAYWGASQEFQVDEPWIHVSDLATGAPEAAKFLARYYGRVSARPRLTVTLGLSQKFYDLRPGHVLQFSTRMEDAGIVCPAYRTGRLDYLFPGSHVSTSQADDTTPTLLSAGGSDREMYAAASHQFPSMTIKVSTAGTYTASANPLQYYDAVAGTWTDLTGTSCSDGRAVNQMLASTGTFTVSWTKPTITSWGKAELTFGAALKGPTYFVRHKAVTVTGAASGNALVTIPATWNGRLFIVRETNRRVGANGYPYMEAVLQEVM